MRTLAFLLLAPVFAPAVAGAITADQLLVNFKTYIIQPIISVLFALALAIFLWGIAEFVWGAGNDTKIEEGKQHMLYGVIGMVIMVSVYGIINVALSIIGK